jgi:hypothetical protein
MRLPTRSFLSTLALVGAVGLVLVASLGGTSAYFAGALVLLIVSAVISMFRIDRRAPEPADTQAFMASVLNGRGYGGAYTIRSFTQFTSAGLEAGHVLVKFRGEIVFHEALFQPATPSPETFEGMPPRKIEWLRKVGALLERELGGPALGLMGRVPPDPFRATFVALRKPAGWSIEFSGSAWAVLEGDMWTWDLRNLSQSIDSLIVQGKPIGAYPAAVAPASPEGSAWLRTNLAAWREFEQEVAALQQQMDELRAERARAAMGGFFHDVQPGSVYHGSGESLTHQITDARYFLEFVSVDAASNAVVFALRSDKRWNAARRFSGTVAFDPGTSTVTVTAQTTAADAQPGAGPFLSVATAFEIELRWKAGSPPHIEGSSADLLLRLHEVGADELEKLLDHVRVRKREIAAATAPGRMYRGTVNIQGSERVLLVEFTAPTDGGAGQARVECAGWSGVFRLGEPDAGALADGTDVSLKSTSPVASGETGEAAPAGDAWNEILLRLHSGRFSGQVVAGEHRFVISQLAGLPSAPP